jgi:hypothetical protein
MTSIKRYDEYVDYDQMAKEFVDAFDLVINESDSTKKDEEYQSILRRFGKDLKLNFNLIGTFATGIGAFAPIVHSMIENMKISTEMDIEKVVLLTICSLTIIYLEEKKFKNQKEEAILIDDSKSMLEELRMMGLGNGIVKMVVKSLKSIKNVFNLIGKHVGTVVSGLTDMLAYTSLMLPIMNGISYIVGKYHMTPETLTTNILGLIAGFGTIAVKHGISYILKKLKGKISPKKEDEILDEIDVPVVQKFSTFDDEEHGEPINEQ